MLLNLQSPRFARILACQLVEDEARQFQCCTSCKSRVWYGCHPPIRVLGVCSGPHYSVLCCYSRGIAIRRHDIDYDALNSQVPDFTRPQRWGSKGALVGVQGLSVGELAPHHCVNWNPRTIQSRVYRLAIAGLQWPGNVALQEARHRSAAGLGQKNVLCHRSFVVGLAYTGTVVAENQWEQVAWLLFQDAHCGSPRPVAGGKGASLMCLICPCALRLPGTGVQGPLQ
jgi:hypothetical protein